MNTRTTLFSFSGLFALSLLLFGAFSGKGDGSPLTARSSWETTGAVEDGAPANVNSRAAPSNFSPAGLMTNGDIKTIDFAAAEPYSYDHSMGGGIYDDGSVTVVESLQGGDFACGDIVTYFAFIEVEASVVDPVNTVQLDFEFLANTTGGAGVAIADVILVQENVGDPGNVNDGGSTVTVIEECTGTNCPGNGPGNGILYDPASLTTAAVVIDDLEAGETLVVRIDVLLSCNPGSSPTGNLQGKLANAQALTGAGCPCGVAGGVQTIPFQQIGQLTGAGEGVLVVNKTVTTSSGTCGVDDVESLTITAGETVKYCYTVYNPGTGDLFDVASITDDNGTPGNTADDFTVALSGLTDIDGDGDLGDLITGGTATGSATVTYPAAGTIVNVATTSGKNADANNADVLTDGDEATVIVEPSANLLPVAENDAASTIEEQPVSGNVLANDGQGDGPATVTANTQPSNGSVSVNPDGTYTYTPDAGFAGTDSFTYTITDSNGDESTATVTISVTDEGAPLANNDSNSTDEGAPVNGSAFDNDDLADDATLDNYTQPSNGSVVMNPDGTYTYTPAPGFTGTDTFTYTICDDDTPTAECSTATVDIFVNALPEAIADANTTGLNTSVGGNVLANDDQGDAPATVTAYDAVSANGGTVVVNADGTYSYTPATGFTGTDTFTYTITDNNGDESTATVTITVDNLLPVAENDAASTIEEQAVSGNVLDNDYQGDGPATVTANTQPSNGSVSVNPDGTYTYTPDAGFAGTDSFTYTITDSNGDESTATVTISVTDEGTPLANNDSNSTDEGAPVNGSAFDNDDLADDATLDNYTQPSNGSVVMNPDGTYTYTPAPGFSGTDTFTYTICDDDTPTAECSTATVEIFVNALPEAIADAASTIEEQPVSGNVLANDDQGDGPATVTANTQPSNGSVSVNPDGTYTYTPDAGFAGTDSFTYTITDSNGDESTATVTISVTDEGTPLANNDSNSTDEGAPVNGSAFDNDDLADDATLDNYTQPSNGSVVMNPDGTYTYTPAPGFSGTDTFTYTICDDDTPTAECSTATVEIFVNALPEAIADAASTTEEQPVSGNVLTNDDQGDGPATVTANTQPSNGSVSVNPDGTYTYTPDAGFAGTDSFTYTITDSNGDESTATVTISVTDEGTPLANNDSNSTDEGAPVNGSAFDNDDLADDATLDNYTQPSNGSVVMNPDGTYTYTPAPGFSGTDTFTYTICDDDTPTAECSTATVEIFVNALPEAIADAASTIEEQPVSGNVLANDDQGDGPATVTANTQPSNGSVSVNPDGTYTYTPDAGFAGTDSFTYTITDSNGDESTATVTISVTDEGTPLANNDSNSTDEGAPVNGSAFDNDDLTDDATLDSYTQPSNGSVVMNPDGTYTYTPAPGFTGTDSFEYTICDDDTPTAECSTATVEIFVNALPEAISDAASTIEEQPVSGNVLANDDQGDGPATVTANTQPSNGSVSVNPDGTYSYTPDAGFAGTDSFTYTITDSNGDESTATVTISVTDEGAPLANNDSNSTDEGSPVNGSAFDNDDLTDDATLDNYTQPSNGSVVMNPDGTYTYTPAPGFTGTDTFTYTICDDDTPTAECSTATVEIFVNALPEAIADAASTTEEQPVSGNVLTNDDQGDGPATVTANTQPSNGSVSVNPDGTYTYTPDAGFAGTDSFTYTITDSNGDESTATVTISVTDEGTPVANNDSNSTDEGSPVNGSAFDNDDLTDDATLDSYTQPSNGSVVMNPDGTYTYTPAPGFSGTDTFTYTICDDDTPTAECSTATVEIFVNALPEAIADAASTIEEQPVSGNVLANDDQGDGPATVTANTQPSNGSVSVNPDGTYTYTPDAGFAGTDSFTYTITDSNGDESTATVTISVTDEGTPLANNDSNSTDEGAPVNGSAFDNDDLADDATLDNYTQPSNGSVVMNPDGTYTYTPAPGFTGTDSFEYTICDDDTPTAECSTATVEIFVNALPEAIADAASTIEEQPVSGNVLANDDQGDGPATVTANTQPSNGSVSVNPDGTYTYTPDAGFAGTDSFTYTITDSNGDESTATVTISVTDEGAPLANNDSNSTDEGSPVNGSAFDNDDLADDATLDNYTQPSNGSVVMNPDGTYTYTPAPGFTGTDTFTYTICDDDTPTAECSTATVTIEVNDLPEALDDNATVDEDGSVTIPVLGNDDQGNGSATIVAVSDPGNGTAVINPDGTITYEPDADFCGTDSFTYTIEDEDGDQSTATVTVTVDCVPDPVDDMAVVDEDGSVDIDVLPNDDQGDGQATVVEVSDPPNGMATINPDGTVNYQPDPDFCGSDSFTYTIEDENGDQGTATVTVEVDCVPDAVDDDASVNDGGSVVIDVLPNDDQGDGPATVVSVSDPGQGTVTINPDGTITYTPDPGACDEDTFTYTIEDQNGDQSTATVTVTIVDTTPPSFSCPADISVENDPSQCGAIATWMDPMATDDCNGVASLTSTSSSGDFFPVGSTTVTYTATDGVGNSASCSFTVTVTDTEAPSIDCPADVTVTADAALCSASNVELGSPATDDNCEVATVENDAPATYPVGSTTVTWTVTDIHGNVNTCQQTIVVTDDEAPSIDCPADVTVTADAALCSASNVELGNPATDDNCEVATVENDAPATYPVGSTTVTWTVTDIHGNVNTCQQTIVVTDDEAPSIDCPADVTVTADAALCSASNVELGNPATDDNCEVATVENDAPATYPVGSTTVTWTVTDIHGNVNTCQQTIVVTDDEAPSIDCPADVTVTADAALCSASNVELGNPATDDNCEVATVENDAPATYAVGSTTVTWTVTDIHGNVNTCEQTVVVTDDEAPSIDCPADVTVTADAALCSASNVELGNPATDDNCEVATVENDAPATYAVGSTTVTWTVTDIHGNVNTCEQTVVVTDDEAPSIDCPADVAVTADAALCSASNVELGNPATDDNCEVATVENDAPATYAVGSTTVTWTVTDIHGNVNTCEQTVVVTDDEAPSIDCPADVAVTADAALCSASGVALGDAITSDNCGVASVSNDAPATYPVGSTTVTWTITDIHGNVNTCEQTVVVTDDEAPSIDCPADVAVTADAALCSASGVALGDAITSDNCGVASVSNDAPATYPVGSTTVTWTITDIHGNVNTCEQIVVVTDDEIAKPTCPADATVECGDPTDVSAMGMATATDNCGVASITHSDATVQSCGATETITRTWTVTDIHGNVSSCDQVIIVVDNTAPAVAPASDMTVECDGFGNTSQLNAWLASNGGATATDICGSVNWTNNYNGLSDDCGTTGSATVTFTATDECGNSSSTTATFTIEDTTAPSFTCPADKMVSCNDDLSVVHPIPSDVCGGTITMDYTEVRLDNNCGGTLGSYQLVRTWTFTDECGNTSEACTQTITVETSINAGCWTLNLVEADYDVQAGTTTYTWELYGNGCRKAVSHILFEMPQGVIALDPTSGAYTYPGNNNSYQVENPATTGGGQNRIYGIKFETIGEGIKDGGPETFVYTLPGEPMDDVTVEIKAGGQSEKPVVSVEGCACGEGLIALRPADPVIGAPVAESYSVLDAEVTVYPNPSHSDVTIAFTLSEAANVTLEVYNLMGARVATLFQGKADAGVRYTEMLQEGTLSYGTYVYRLYTKEGAYQGKIIILD